MVPERILLRFCEVQFGSVTSRFRKSLASSNFFVRFVLFVGVALLLMVWVCCVCICVCARVLMFVCVCVYVCVIYYGKREKNMQK